MEITERLTSDAEVRKTKNNKEVVGFTVVMNDYYKTKDGEKKEHAEFINCSYWQGTKVADTLLKGTIVTVSGRLYLNEYTAQDGKHHAYLAFHVNSVNIILVAKRKTAEQAITTEVATPESKDNLPF